ncbi:MAG TPA: glycosyltransferase family 4 protein [Bradyrhizobium sp.]|nr:glycosyltransferase family 4 protein [Bradyrhizobium sp.]
MNVALLLSCGSFEGFFGRVLGQTAQSYVAQYRNDWAWYYAQGLLENGVGVTIYIPSLHESAIHKTELGISIRFLPIESWYKPIELFRLRRLSRATRWSLYVEERINAMAFIKSLRDSIRHDKIDLLYIQEYWTGRFDHLVHRIDIPVVGADHGALAQGVFKMFKREALGKAALCYAQTFEECKAVEQWGGRPKFQPNGCDVSEFFPDPAVRRGKTVLTVARLTDKQKRTSDLIRAMARLGDEWTLDIVGTGPDRGMLEKLAVDLGLSARVRFHGFVNRAGVRDFLRRCGVYVMPSTHEAVAIAALEAMACGAAVVLTKIRGFEALVSDGVNGRLVPVRDVEALSRAIPDAWNHREAWGEAACKTVQERYNMRVLYAQLAQSLREAAGRRT